MRVDVEDEVVAGGAEHLDARVDRLEALRRRVLAPEGADGAPPVPPIDEGREVAERILRAGALRQRRLDQALDDRRGDGDRVVVQAERRLAGQRVHAEQDGLPDAQVVDGGRHAAGGDHADGAGVAAGDQQRPAELLDALRRQLGQPAHVVLVRDDRAVTGEVDADAGDVDVVHGVDALEERRQVLGQHALAQVAEVDHGDDGVPPAGSGGGVLQGDDRLERALQRDVRELHGLAGELGDRRAQQPDGRRKAGVPEALGVLEPRLAERLGPAGQHRPGHLRRAARDLGDGDDGDARQVVDEGPRVRAHLAQIDGDCGSCRHDPPMHKTYAREYRFRASPASTRRRSPQSRSRSTTLKYCADATSGHHAERPASSPRARRRRGAVLSAGRTGTSRWCDCRLPGPAP